MDGLEEDLKRSMAMSEESASLEDVESGMESNTTPTEAINTTSTSNAPVLDEDELFK
jgi:hypothetical protein